MIAVVATARAAARSHGHRAASHVRVLYRRHNDMHHVRAHSRDSTTTSTTAAIVIDVATAVAVVIATTDVVDISRHTHSTAWGRHAPHRCRSHGEDVRRRRHVHGAALRRRQDIHRRHGTGRRHWYQQRQQGHRSHEGGRCRHCGNAVIHRQDDSVKRRVGSTSAARPRSHRRR